MVERHKLKEYDSLLFNGVVSGNLCLQELCQEVKRHAVCRREDTQQVKQQLNIIGIVPGWGRTSVCVCVCGVCVCVCVCVCVFLPEGTHTAMMLFLQINQPMCVHVHMYSTVQSEHNVCSCESLSLQYCAQCSHLT